ncbi:integrase core domain-containing protein [Sporocytophaga myxococcoides]|uniref:integrase core domain-containing protein n=1 Tax=Sporocytophaga myxococcoides TaxID=153721 RepID=UPI0009DF9C99
MESAIAERVNGILKDELLEEYFSDFKTAQNFISKAISIYNNIRLHYNIEMLTPEQAHTMKGEFKRR